MDEECSTLKGWINKGKTAAYKIKALFALNMRICNFLSTIDVSVRIFVVGWKIFADGVRAKIHGQFSAIPGLKHKDITEE